MQLSALHLTSHFASTKVSSQSLAAVDTDRVGMLARTAAAPGRVLSQSYLQGGETCTRRPVQNTCTSSTVSVDWRCNRTGLLLHILCTFKDELCLGEVASLVQRLGCPCNTVSVDPVPALYRPEACCRVYNSSNCHWLRRQGQHTYPKLVPRDAFAVFHHCSAAAQ